MGQKMSGGKAYYALSIKHAVNMLLVLYTLSMPLNDKQFARFMKKVSFDSSGCWLWTGSRGSTGYGIFFIDNSGGIFNAHRVAFDHFKHPIASGMEIDHLCFIRHCVNPEHLEMVTRDENLRRARLHRPLKTHCKRGHSLETFYKSKRTGRETYGRVCKVCHAQAVKRWKLRHPEHWARINARAMKRYKEKLKLRS